MDETKQAAAVGQGAPRVYRTRDDADQNFGEAIIHRPGRRCRPGWSGHVVLGHRLRPYSYWHAQQLDYLESPIVGYEGRMNLPALFLAVRVCQLKCPRTYTPATWLREMWVAYRYGAELLPVRTGLVVKFVSPFLRELGKFSAYLRDYNARPICGATNAQPSRLPWHLAEVAMARRFNPQLTWRDAWNLEVGKTAWEIAAMIEAQGGRVSVESAAMREAAREAGYEV